MEELGVRDPLATEIMTFWQDPSTLVRDMREPDTDIRSASTAIVTKTGVRCTVEEQRQRGR
jgi:hypothetical protein